MKLFVWDFHGVLEKGTDKAALALSNVALKNHGYSEQFDESHTHILFGKKWYQYFEHILPHEPHETHVKLQEYCFSTAEKNPPVVLDYVEVNDYARDVLHEVANKHQQILISNTRTKHLPLFLEKTKLSAFFSKVNAFAVDNHQKDIFKTKADVLRTYLSENPQYKSIVVIGDSPEDTQLVNVTDGVSYLYARPGLPFKDAPAHFKIRDLREVLREL